MENDVNPVVESDLTKMVAHMRQSLHDKVDEMTSDLKSSITIELYATLIKWGDMGTKINLSSGGYDYEITTKKTKSNFKL